MRYRLEIEPELAKAAPGYRVMLVEADVENGQTPAELTEAIAQWGRDIMKVMEMGDIKNRPGIASTREVYKRLGKDPNRYRPSHEQMMRRFFKEQGLYEVSALVDAGNLLSLMSGYSVGVFDAEKVEGDVLKVGVGKAGEPYEGIGRGPLNIEGLPVVRDSAGGIGTPTSDNMRTRVDDSTRRIVMTLHIFREDLPVEETEALVKHLLTTYCHATGIETQIYSA